MTNPLIAPTQDSTKAYSGISLLETANDLSSAIESGDWASVAMGAVGTALDALSVAMDPFGAILAAGVSWLMEHVGPLKDALNGLTGNADQIKAQSETWANVAKELGAVASDLNDAVMSDLQTWSGDAADAYRKRAQDLSTLLQSAQKGCEGASSGVKTAGEVVAAVRTLVRDIISELIGHLISWALQVVFTLGIGLGWVIPQVVSAVAKTASQIASITTKLIKALQALVPLLKKSGTLFEDAGKAFKSLKAGTVTAAPKVGDVGPMPKAPPKPAGSGGGIPKDGVGTKASSSDAPPPVAKSPDGGGATHPSSAGGGDGTHVSSAGGGTPPPKLDSPPASRGLDDAPSGGGGGPIPRGGPDTTTPSGAPRSRGLDGPAAKDTPPPLKDQGENPRPMDNLRCENDPIDVSTGQMVLPEVDARFDGGLPLVFERTHFSSYRAGRLFGSSWVSTVDQRLEVDDEGVSFASADGVIQRFRHPEVDAWTRAEQGPMRSLTRLDNGGYLIDDAAGSVARYFAPGPGALPLSSVSDRNGNRVEFDYDDAGSPLGVRHSAGYAVRIETTEGLVTGLFSVAPDGSEIELARYGYTDGRLTAVFNGSGQAFRYEYDEAGRVVAWIDRNESWYRYTYDDAGRCVRTEGAGGFLSGTMEYDTENRITYSTDTDGHRSEFHLNEAGQVVREVDPLGNATTFEWTTHDQLLSSTDPLGRTTSYDYDDAGNVLRVARPDGSEIAFERNDFGQPLTMSEAPGVVTRWEYDGRGNLLKHSDPAGAETVYTYDEAGNVTSMTDPGGNTTRVEPGFGGLPASITDATGATVSYQRDQFGRVVAVADAAGGVEQFGYTVSGAVTWHRHADGSVEQWLFDGEDNNRTHTTAAGATTWSEITHGDLPSAEIRPDGTQVRFEYDSRLRVVSTTNEQGLVWRYEYDPAGRLVRETDFAGVSTTYRHDAAGQVVEESRGGDTVTMRYDLLGRIVERTRGGSTTRYTYEIQGFLATAENAESRVEFRRDEVGRVLAETVNERTVFSSYDRLGRRVRRVTPSGAETVCEYSAHDRPVALRAGGQTVRFEYDRAGREVRRVLGSGAALTQSWTPRSQLAAQAITDPAGRATQQRAYRYRSDGVLAQVRDELTGPRSFALDVRGRVTGVDGPGWSERYVYDKAGNVVDGRWPTTTGHDALGRRSVVGTVITTAGGVRYGHDARGRMVLRRGPSGSECRFTWDSDDHLTSVTTNDGTRWRYHYDALGRRIAKVHLGPGGTSVLERVEFAWDGEFLVEQARALPGGVDVTVWDYEPGGFTPLLQRHRLRHSQDWVNARFHAIVTDQAGAPAELVDEHGAIAWHARATLWGNTDTTAPSTADTPLRFEGQYFDAETGLHYNYHRYYDPILARYLSPDPMGLDGGPNLHAYVSNPHVLADPLGLMPQACSGVPVYKQSPGGSTYQQLPPAGHYMDGIKKPTRRNAAGYNNPGHDEAHMLPMWQGRAQTPPPPDMDPGRYWADHYSKPERHYQTYSNTGQDTGIITSHSNGVFGHSTAASKMWNDGGHKQPRIDNYRENQKMDHYHGIEERHNSSASGSRDPRYMSPGPEHGSHPSYWNQEHPDFQTSGGGPWHSYKKVGGPGEQGPFPDYRDSGSASPVEQQPPPWDHSFAQQQHMVNHPQVTEQNWHHYSGATGQYAPAPVYGGNPPVGHQGYLTNHSTPHPSNGPYGAPAQYPQYAQGSGGPYGAPYGGPSTYGPGGSWQ